MATAVGIDLGTTNSVIAAMEGDNLRSSPMPRAIGPHRRWSPSSIPGSGLWDRWPGDKRS